MESAKRRYTINNKRKEESVLIMYNQALNRVENQVHNQVWNQVPSQVDWQVNNQVRSQVRNQVKNQVNNQVVESTKRRYTINNKRKKVY